MHIVGIHHVALTVRNRDVSAAWYASTLRFEELFREDGDERRACVMRFPGGGYSVGLVEHTAAPQEPFDPQRVGLDHVAFSVASREELEQWADELTRAGIEHSGVVEIPPGAILNFKDPDGIALALFWDRS
jgi:catechol-2,3-dioxygenase